MKFVGIPLDGKAIVKDGKCGGDGVKVGKMSKEVDVEGDGKIGVNGGKHDGKW